MLFMHNKAFTLIETLVAISIIMFAITGPFLIAESGLRASNQSIEKTVAIYYAQDAIEQAINNRDNNLIKGATNALVGVCEKILALNVEANKSPSDLALEKKYNFTRSIDCDYLRDSASAPDSNVITMKVKILRFIDSQNTKTIIEINQLLFNYASQN